MKRKGWLMELAEREHQLIRTRGHDHFLTIAARQHFKEAWLQVDSIRKSFGSPPYRKEQG